MRNCRDLCHINNLFDTSEETPIHTNMLWTTHFSFCFHLELSTFSEAITPNQLKKFHQVKVLASHSCLKISQSQTINEVPQHAHHRTSSLNWTTYVRQIECDHRNYFLLFRIESIKKTLNSINTSTQYTYTHGYIDDTHAHVIFHVV